MASIESLLLLLCLTVITSCRCNASCPAPATYSASTDCAIVIDTNFVEPLIVSDRGDGFVYPASLDTDSTASPANFVFDEPLQIFCGQGRNFTSTKQDLVCRNDKKTRAGPQDEVHRLSCDRKTQPVAEVVEPKGCGAGGDKVRVGFRLSVSKFLKTIELCHDSSMGQTHWSHGRIVSAIRNKQIDHHGETKSFVKGKFFESIPISQVYPRKNQREIFLEIFKSPKLVDRYVPVRGENFFVKGHLVPRADQFYITQQSSTFFYVNVVPMWQSVNNGNWKKTENLARELAATTDLDVWTGTVGVLELPDDNGVPKQIYLGRKNGKPVVPVPENLFKVIYDPAKNAAIVFVTINNPHLTKVEKRICKEYTVCGERFPQFRKLNRGFTYCCTYEDFMKNQAVRNISLPKFTNVKILIK